MHPRNDLRQRLIGDILGYIQRHGLPEGSRLTEKALCDEFKVSRTPVRAALALLARDGVIRHVRNKGYFTRMAASAISREAATDSEEDLFYLRLTGDRFAGELDDEFTEADLLRRYRVPKRTLTRVLHRLLRETLVEKRPGRGWTFVDILDSKQAHDESYRFRLVVEPAGLLEPSFSIDPARLLDCRAAHEEILAGKAGSISSIMLFEMNADFHQMLADFSRNRFFQQAMQHQNNLRRIISYQWVYGPERVVDTCQEHLAIITAVEAGDGMWAANLLRKHIAGAAELSPYNSVRGDAPDPWHIRVDQGGANGG